MKPILSVLFPCFNYKKGLTRNLDYFSSLDAYFLKSIEILVSDNSQVPLLEEHEIAHYSKCIGYFDYTHNQISTPACKNWNYLIDKAHGEYLWLIHHDEYIVGIEALLAELLEKKYKVEADIYILRLRKSHEYRLRQKILVALYRHQLPIILARCLLRLDAKILVYCNFIGPASTLVIRKAVVQRYSIKYTWYLDVEYYIRQIKSCDVDKICFLPEHSGYVVSEQSRHLPTITSSLAGKIGSLSKAERSKLERGEHSYLCAARWITQWPIKVLMRCHAPIIEFR